jgi:hypothetical protein
MAEAFTYVINAGGITSSSTYPYTASKGSCRFDPSTAAAQLTGFTDVQTDEAALMKVRWADGCSDLQLLAAHALWRLLIPS